MQGGVLQLQYLTVSQDGWDDASNAVALVFPDAYAALDVESINGRSPTKTLSSPCVGVFAAPRRAGLHERRPGNMLLMSLDRDFIAEGARKSSREFVGLRTEVPSVDPYLRRLGDTLLSAYRVGMEPPAAFRDAMARQVRDHLCAHYAAQPTGAAPPLAAWRLERAIGYMERNFTSDILVDDIAAAAGLSPFYFARTFCAATGKGPHAYLIDLRMAEARRLLHDTNLPVAEIAKRVGYRTHAHFTNVFRENLRVTPLAYRKRSRSN